MSESERGLSAGVLRRGLCGVSLMRSGFIEEKLRRRVILGRDLGFDCWWYIWDSMGGDG